MAIAFIDPVAAARLLEANGVLDRARQHMRFYPVTIKGAEVSVPAARRSDPE